MVGGYSEIKPADEGVKDILQKIKADVESSQSTSFDIFECEGYKSQVVAGTNYTIKVRISQEEEKSHLHIQVFSPLPHTGQPCEIKNIVGPVDANTNF